MTTFTPANALGPFLPQSQVFPEDYNQLIIKLTKFYTDVANTVNVREIAFYDLTETVTGQQWFSPNNSQRKRQTFRKIVPFTNPLAAGANTQAHGIAITPSFVFTLISATLIRPAPFLAVPIPQGGANTSSIEVDATNITITIPAAYAGFNAVTILEYLKN